MTSRLTIAIPKLASLDIERSLVFFERLGFVRHGDYPDYGMVSRDGVELHFWRCMDAAIPKATGCRIVVQGIETIYAEYAALGVVHPNDPLSTKPWGNREFSILDPDGNLLTFQESLD